MIGPKLQLNMIIVLYIPAIDLLLSPPLVIYIHYLRLQV